MKEEQAKIKRCGGPNGCGALINPASGGKIPQEMLLQLAVEVNSPRWCIGSECMMWESWEYEKLEHGVGMESKAIIVHKGEGDCGLKTKEFECNAS